MSKDSTKTGPKQMEASALSPAKVGTPHVNTERVCWAAKTLVAEVHELFPETPVEYSNPDGRNTMLDVTFDATVLDADEADTLASLLELLRPDIRVHDVLVDGDEDRNTASLVLVSFKANARTQDSRDSFGLADAYSILAEGEPDPDSEEWRVMVNGEPAAFDGIPVESYMREEGSL